MKISSFFKFLRLCFSLYNKICQKEIEKILEMKGRFNADIQSELSMVQMYYKRMCTLKVPDDLDNFFSRSPYVKNIEWFLEEIAEFSQAALDEERKAAKPSEEEIQKLETVQSWLGDVIKEKEDKQVGQEDEISEDEKRKMLIASILAKQQELAGLKDTLKELEPEEQPVYDE